MRLHRLAFVVLAAVTSLAATCSPARDDISRERAITIARSQVTFSPDDIQAQRSTSSGASVWRVTLRGRLPGQPPLLFETAIVEVDAHTGRIVSLARP